MQREQTSGASRVGPRRLGRAAAAALLVGVFSALSLGLRWATWVLFEDPLPAWFVVLVPVAVAMVGAAWVWRPEPRPIDPRAPVPPVCGVAVAGSALMGAAGSQERRRDAALFAVALLGLAVLLFVAAWTGRVRRLRGGGDLETVQWIDQLLHDRRRAVGVLVLVGFAVLLLWAGIAAALTAADAEHAAACRQAIDELERLSALPRAATEPVTDAAHLPRLADEPDATAGASDVQ